MKAALIISLILLNHISVYGQKNASRKIIGMWVGPSIEHYDSIKLKSVIYQDTIIFFKDKRYRWASDNKKEGVWTIGFQTGTPGGDVVNHLPGDYVSVYVPTTPNPTGGYFVMLKRTDCIELNMSVDQALTYVISMGVVVPGSAATYKPK